MIDIDNLILEARKSRNSKNLKAYQNIKVEIQKNQTAKCAKPLTDELQLQIISKYAKSLEEAISQFLEAGRDDLVSEYREELEVIKKLLPEPVTESQIMEELCKWAGNCKLVETGISTKDGIEYKIQCRIPKNEKGNAIKYLKSKFPIADGRVIARIVDINIV